MSLSIYHGLVTQDNPDLVVSGTIFFLCNMNVCGYGVIW